MGAAERLRTHGSHSLKLHQNCTRRDSSNWTNIRMYMYIDHVHVYRSPVTRNNSFQSAVILNLTKYPHTQESDAPS